MPLAPRWSSSIITILFDKTNFVGYTLGVRRMQAGKLMAKIGFLDIKNHPKRMQLKIEGLTAWVAL